MGRGKQSMVPESEVLFTVCVHACVCDNYL